MLHNFSLSTLSQNFILYFIIPSNFFHLFPTLLVVYFLLQQVLCSKTLLLFLSSLTFSRFQPSFFLRAFSAMAKEFVNGSVHQNGVIVIIIDRLKALNAINLGFSMFFFVFIIMHVIKLRIIFRDLLLESRLFSSTSSYSNTQLMC